MAISPVVGLRFPGGRQKTVLEIRYFVRSSPMEASIRSSNCPLGPTKGMPLRSSSAPGASPMKMMGACGLPSAKTRWVAVFFNPHPSKFSRVARSSSTLPAAAAALQASPTAPSAPIAGTGGVGGAGGSCAGKLGAGCSADGAFSVPRGDAFAAFEAWNRSTGTSPTVSSTPASKYHSRTFLGGISRTMSLN